VQAVQETVTYRQSLVTERSEAFNAAHDQARDEFFLKFVKIDASIDDAPQPDLAGLDGEDTDAAGQQTTAQQHFDWARSSFARTAATGAASATVGSGVGGAAAYATFLATAAWGTASTGVPIAALSGVAATNATFAALGGGSLAAGGAGIAGGTAVLAGIVAVPAALLTVGAVAWIIRRRRIKLAKMLDEAEEEIRSTQPGFDALVDTLASATAVLDDIAVHAGRALSKCALSTNKRPCTWESLTTTDRQRYKHFAELCACQIAVATVDISGFLTSEGQDLHDLIAGSKQIIAESQRTVDRLV
jgi:hypothetical protein